jgi:hypothetical protein
MSWRAASADVARLTRNTYNTYKKISNKRPSLSADTRYTCCDLAFNTSLGFMYFTRVCRVARFILLKLTKTGKMNQITLRYTKKP